MTKVLVFESDPAFAGAGCGIVGAAGHFSDLGQCGFIQFSAKTAPAPTTRKTEASTPKWIKLLKLITTIHR